MSHKEFKDSELAGKPKSNRPMIVLWIVIAVAVVVAFAKAI